MPRDSIATAAGTKSTRAPTPPAVPAPYVEIEDLAGRLEHVLAHHGEHFRVDEWLASARVIEALRHCIGGWVGKMSPEEWRQQPDETLSAGLNRTANELRTLAEQFGRPVKGQGRYPSSTARIDKAAGALRDRLALVMQPPTGQDKRLPPPPREPHDLAVAVEGLRMAFVDIGSRQVLPHNGTFDERVAAFTTAIEQLRQNTEGGDLEARAVIVACARACGTKRELFGAERKKQKRKKQ